MRKATVPNLVGQTFVRSYKKNGAYISATLTVLDEVFDATDGGKRKYVVHNLTTNEQFRADAEIYDRTFLVVRSKPLPKAKQKGETIYSPGHPDYKMKK
jgi:hypothetical protein